MIVLPRFPYPLEKGDKLRAYHQIRTLSKNNEIYLFCVSHQHVEPEQVEALKQYCAEIVIAHPFRLVSYKNVVRNFIRTKSLQVGYWDSRMARQKYKEFEKRVKPDVIYSQMVRTMPLVSRSRVPKVMDFQDSLSMNTERRMELTSKGLWHWVLHHEFKMLRSTEYNSFKIFDDLVIISEADSDAIPHKKNGNIKIVPNGVDLDFFHPMEREIRYDLVFCGNMQYAPNVNACKYLVEQVMPLVWKVLPETTLMLAGTSPKPAVRALAGPKVQVSGWVDDIRECYAAAKVFVAPMQMGSGLQNKLLEAMAMGLPCVTTSIANDALGSQEVMIGNTPEELAGHIVNLLQDESLRSRLAANGKEYVEKNYSWEVFGEKLEAILKNVCGK